MRFLRIILSVLVMLLVFKNQAITVNTSEADDIIKYGVLTQVPHESPIITFVTEEKTIKKQIIKDETKETEEPIVTLSVSEPEMIEGTYTYYEVYDYYYGTEDYHALDYELQRYTYDLCLEYEIEEYYTLILCQLFYESMYKTDVISSTNDYGIAQINKCNHKYLSEILGVTDFLDAKQSILCNIYMMSTNLKKTSANDSLYCYNTGKRQGTNKYSENIMYMWNNGVREIQSEE